MKSLKQRKRTNLLAQESVVSALWEFAHDINQRPSEECNCENLDLHVRLHLDDVGLALEKVMRAFRYEVVSVQ